MSSGKTNESPDSEACNVQYDSDLYPSGVTEAPVTFRVTDDFEFDTAGGGSAKLKDCYGRWTWTTLTHSGSITQGAQLAVGAPFPALLNGAAGLDFNSVRVFFKARLDDENFSAVYIAISDQSGNLSSSSNIVSTWSSAFSWQVASHAKTGSWDDWDKSNLRIVLTFLGPASGEELSYANLVDIEWIAIWLTGDD